MSGLVLSLFPGIGLLDMAFEAEGFCVVRGPDLLWGGDIRKFHPPAGKFDGVIGGPPCQAFSQLRFIVQANGYKTAENLIPEFERCVAEARPNWFLMENVPTAPRPFVSGYITTDQVFRDAWAGGKTNRMRRFSFCHRYGLGWFAEFNKQLSSQMLALHSIDADRMAELQGASDLLQRLREHGAFTASAMKTGLGNGVPLPMGRAVARAVKAALDYPTEKQNEATNESINLISYGTVAP